MFCDLLQSVVPETVVEPLPDQFQGGLGPEGVLGRHVQVVHERDHLFAAGRNVDSLGSLLNATFDDLLHIVRRGLQRRHTAVEGEQPIVKMFLSSRI